MMGKIFYVYNTTYQKVFVIMVYDESHNYDTGSHYVCKLLLDDPTPEEQRVFDRYYRRIAKDQLDSPSRYFFPDAKEAKKQCGTAIRADLKEAFSLRDKCIRRKERMERIDPAAMEAKAKELFAQTEKDRIRKQREIEVRERAVERRANIARPVVCAAGPEIREYTTVGGRVVRVQEPDVTF